MTTGASHLKRGGFERASWRCIPPPGGGLPALEVVAATKVGAVAAVQRLLPEIQRHAAVQYHYEIVKPAAPGAGGPAGRGC